MNFLIRAAIPMVVVLLILCVLVMFSPALAVKVSALSMSEMIYWIIGLILFSALMGVVTGKD